MWTTNASTLHCALLPGKAEICPSGRKINYTPYLLFQGLCWLGITIGVSLLIYPTFHICYHNKYLIYILPVFALFALHFSNTDSHVPSLPSKFLLISVICFPPVASGHARPPLIKKVRNSACTRRNMCDRLMEPSEKQTSIYFVCQLQTFDIACKSLLVKILSTFCLTRHSE